MKINEIRNLPPAAAIAAPFPSRVRAADYALTEEQGASFVQLDFGDNSPPVTDSAVGMLETSQLLLRVSSGYLNAAVDGNRVARNGIVRSVPEHAAGSDHSAQREAQVGNAP